MNYSFFCEISVCQSVQHVLVLQRYQFSHDAPVKWIKLVENHVKVGAFQGGGMIVENRLRGGNIFLLFEINCAILPMLFLLHTPADSSLGASFYAKNGEAGK